MADKIKTTEELTDQATLAEIVQKAWSKTKKLEALEKLTDQTLIADIVKKSDVAKDVLQKAWAKLTDETVIRDIARNALNYGVRDAAKWKLNDILQKRLLEE